jgi:hypothetical protein
MAVLISCITPIDVHFLQRDLIRIDLTQGKCLVRLWERRDPQRKAMKEEWRLGGQNQQLFTQCPVLSVADPQYPIPI